MAYSDFDLATARDRFNLKLVEDADLFSGTAPVEASSLLRQALAEWVPMALAINTEKARSELIIMPILTDVVRQTDRRVSLFSGVALDVDRASGLSGTCDFLLTRSPERFFVSRPVVTVIEAKKEDIIGGLGQCAAAMVGAQLFNARHGEEPGFAVHGAVTSGSVWRFLRLEGTTLTIDGPEYYLADVGKILAILLASALGPVPASTDARLSA